MAGNWHGNGMGAAGAPHGMCELAFTLFYNRTAAIIFSVTKSGGRQKVIWFPSEVKLPT
jgi:hypothetical protein